MSGTSSNKGFRILLLDTKSENPNHYICLAIREALKGMADVELVVKADYSNAVSLAAQNNCDLFIAFDAEALDRLICSRVAAVCGTSVLWVTEDPYEMSVNVGNADLFDLVFTNDSGCVHAYGAKGRHLPLAGAKPYHYLPIQEDVRKLRYDVFFAGTAWPNRVSLLKEVLATQWGGETIKAKIALPTNQFLPPRDLSLPLSQINWRTSPADFARFANSSLTTLVLPRVFSASGNRDFAETPPPRLYEAALAGTVQLVQSKLADAAKYFEPGKDFLYFDSAKSLTDSLAALKEDPKLRYDITRRAQKKALSQHCYENRMATILAEVKALKKQARPIEMTAKSKAKPRVLFVVHNIIGNLRFGGVEVYLKHMCGALADEYEPYYYMSSPHSHPYSAVLYDGQGNSIHTYQFSTPITYWQLSNAEREHAFTSALTKLNISLVHFHHFIGHVPSLVEVAKVLGIPTVMTMHDYYSVCNEFMLLDFNWRYCHPDQIPLSQCDVCLLDKHQILPGSQAARRTYWDKILRSMNALIFNTEGSRELTARIYPSVATHQNVIILPVPMDPVPVRPKAPLSDKEPMKVAVLGNFNRHKGSNVIARIVPLMAGSNIEFHIFASSEWCSLLQKNEYLPYVHVHGPYEPGQFPEVIHSCHVSLHMSIWPETYCLTLTEAWDHGMVPIVSDIGALAERVTQGVDGFKIPADSEGDLEQILRRLRETPGLLEKMQKNIAKAPISRTEPHVTGLKKVYRDAILKGKLNDPNNGLMAQERYFQFWLPKAENWAEIIEDSKPVVPVKQSPPIVKLGIKVAKLGVRGVKYYRKHGLVSMVRRTVRFVKEKLGA